MMSRFLCLSLLAALSSAQAQDAVEDRFHSIYKNYNEKPLSNEEWAKIVGEKSSELAVVYVTYKFSIKGIWLSWRVLVIETKLA